MRSITSATARALCEAYRFAVESNQGSVTAVKDGDQTFEVRSVIEGRRKDIRLIVKEERPDEVWTAMEIRHVVRICMKCYIPSIFSDPEMTDGCLVVRSDSLLIELSIWDGRPCRKVECPPKYPERV